MPPDAGAATTRTTAERDRLARMARFVTELGSSAALLTALLYYFGWSRSEAQARAFGADASVFTMSTQDFVLRSITPLFPVMFVLLLLVLLALRLHRRMLAAIPTQPGSKAKPGRPVRVLVSLLHLSWVLALVVAVALPRLSPALSDAIFPLLVGFGIAGTAYGVALRRRIARREELSAMAIILVAGLLVVCAFWATERFAREIGEFQAADIKANLPWRLRPVTVFSAGQLHLTGVRTTTLTATDAQDSYRYRYEGMFFLQRSGDRYFFLTEGWDRGQGRLIVLTDTEAIRVEFGQ